MIFVEFGAPKQFGLFFKFFAFLTAQMHILAIEDLLQFLALLTHPKMQMLVIGDVQTMFGGIWSKQNKLTVSLSALNFNHRRPPNNFWGAFRSKQIKGFYLQLFLICVANPTGLQPNMWSHQ